MPRRRRPPRPGALADLAPTRILTQIIILQLAYYATALVLIVFTALAAGKHINPDLLLGWEVLRGDVTEGWMFGLVWMLDSLVTVIYLLLLIARSKLVPDFALTIHLLHLFATTLYSGRIPRNVFWWGLQLASAGLMTSLGIWSCQWRELQPINFGGRATASGVGDGAAESSRLVNGDEDGVGFPRGQGRGRGRDGADVYEMFPHK